MAVTSARRTPMGAIRRRETIAGVIFALPWILSLLIFSAYPVLATVFFSLTEYSVVEPPRWVGLDNYETMLTADPAFWTSVGNSAYYALLSVPLSLVCSLGLALILNMRATGIGVYRTLFYLPTLAPPVATTIVFMLLFSTDGGLVNALFEMVGIRGPGWFSEPEWSKPGLIIMHLWGLGSAVLIFLAGLKEVPQTLLEAAVIDGANPWQRFRHVVVPLISPVILFNLVMGVIASFQVFTSAFVIGGTTGAPLESMLMYMIHIYRNAFGYFQMGYASALAVVLFLAILVLTLAILRSSGRWVYFEGGGRAR